MSSMIVVNMALDRVSVGPLRSLGDKGNVADTVRRYYRRAVEVVLRKRLWSEASLVCSLDLLEVADLSTFPDGKCYAFALPKDFIRAVNVWGGDKGCDPCRVIDAPDWRVMSVKTPNGVCQALVTECGAVRMEYVFIPENLDILPPDACDVIALKLAEYLAMPLKSDKSLRNTIAEEFVEMIGDAGDISEGQDQCDVLANPGEFLEARDCIWSGSRVRY